MYVCMYASSVSKRLLQHGGRALVPPPAAFLKEESTSVPGPICTYRCWTWGPPHWAAQRGPAQWEDCRPINGLRP